MERQKTKKKQKSKSKRLEVSDSSDSSDTESNPSSDSRSESLSSNGRGRFDQDHEDWARGLMEDLRDEWKEEDGQLYVKVEERDDIMDQVTVADKKANNLLTLLQEHQKLTADNR